MPLERTLIIVKPDGFKNGWTDDILARYTDAGMTILTQQTLRLSELQAEAFYHEHAGKFFFTGLVLSMTAGPVVVAMLEGEDAITTVRALNGATNPAEALPGTIRRDFRSAGGPFNTVHSSDSPEAFLREWDILSSNWPEAE